MFYKIRYIVDLKFDLWRSFEIARDFFIDWGLNHEPLWLLKLYMIFEKQFDSRLKEYAIQCFIR